MIEKEENTASEGELQNTIPPRLHLKANPAQGEASKNCMKSDSLIRRSDKKEEQVKSAMIKATKRGIVKT